MPRLYKFLRWAITAAAALTLLAYAVLAWRWQYRTPLEELPWAIVESLPDAEGRVAVTWLGVSSLLFDDGETQILIDGYFSRASAFELATFRPLRSDVATINYAMDEFRMDRLAAIVPVHAHLDHAMDVGHVANRSTALIIGSESIANIARGADVPVNQFQILANGESRIFGEFTVTLIESRHVPVGAGPGGWPGGEIEDPLLQPARVWNYREGIVHSVLISHPSGTSLVQGSAGFDPGVLSGQSADVVFLGVAGLAANGRDYTEEYWRETVGATGAREVYAVHFDDFTLPFGQVELLPDIADRVVVAAEWINEIAEKEDIRVRRPPFGIPVVLY